MKKAIVWTIAIGLMLALGIYGLFRTPLFDGYIYGDRHLVGATAPAFTLMDYQSRPVSLEEFKGSATVLVFWSPT